MRKPKKKKRKQSTQSIVCEKRLKVTANEQALGSTILITQGKKIKQTTRSN